MNMTQIVRGCLAGIFCLSSFAVAAIEDPQQMVRLTGERVLAEVTARKADLEADPSLVYPLVQETVIPHFDFRSMSRSAMGRFWRRASDAQKLQVTEQFRELLVRTYATALLGYSGQQIEYLPVQYPANATKVMIPTRISAANSPPIPISYRLSLKDGEKWMVYDVVIDGVSLITNYRSQFATAVQRQGIDGLIGALTEKNRQSNK